MMARTSIFLSVLVSVTLYGCATYSKPAGELPSPVGRAKAFEQTWQAAQAVLDRYHFDVEYTDRRSGRIVTEPMVGKQWFEFWRRDAVTGFDLAESSIQTLYRQAEVHVHPEADGDDRFVAEVVVNVWRSTDRQMQITSASQAYQVFGQYGGRDMWIMQSSNEPATGGVVELEDDEELAAKIQADIQSRAARQ